MAKRERPKQSTSLEHIVDMERMTTLPGLGEEVYKVAAIMFHPNDGAARKTFVASAQVDMMHRLEDAKYLSGNAMMSLPPRDISILHIDRLLDEAMPMSLRFKGGKSGDRGGGYTGTVIAASILARALIEAEKGNDELGIAQIISAQGDEYRQEGVIGTGRDNLTEIWQEYRASAHISLACLELGPGRRLLEDPNVLFEWTGRSMDLLKAGNTVGNRFGAPILPERECWSLVWRPSFGG